MPRTTPDIPYCGRIVAVAAVGSARAAPARTRTNARRIQFLVGCGRLVRDPRLGRVDQMRLDVGIRCLPRLQVEVDLHPRLLVTEGGRDLDDDRLRVLGHRHTLSTPQELEEIL